MRELPALMRGRRAIAGLAVVAVGGLSGGIALAATPGSLDSSFGDKGIVAGALTPAGSAENSGVDSVVAGSDGSLYAGGLVDAGSTEAVVGKYTSTGALVSSFGTGGEAVAPEAAYGDASDAFALVGEGGARVALAPDGDILVAYTGEVDSNPAFAIAAFTPSGDLDTGFGTDGVLEQQLSSYGAGPDSEVTGIAVSSGGEIFLSGYAVDSSDVDDAVVLALTQAGVPVTGFGSSGVWEGQTNGSSASRATDIIIDSSGDPVISASATTGSSDMDFGILRLTPAGTVDSSFVPPSAPLTGTSGGAAISTSLVQQADGDYVEVGTVEVTAGATPEAEPVAVAYGPSGSLDSSFGDDGVASSPGSSGTLEIPTSVVIGPEGKLLLSGISENFGDAGLAQFVTSINQHGAVNTGFGDDGTELTSVGLLGGAMSGTITPSGELVTGGLSANVTAGTTSGYLAEQVIDPAPTVSVSAAAPIVQVGDSISFTATAADGDGSTPTYSWSVDGNPASGTGSTFTTSFGSSGNHTVTVTVTDAEGKSASASATVYALAAPSATTVTTVVTTPTSAAAPAATAAPKLSVTSVKVASKDVVDLKLAAANGAITGTASLTAVEHLTNHKLEAVTAALFGHRFADKVKKTTKTVTVGSTSFSVATNTSRALVLKLNQGGLALLKKYKKLSLKLTVKETSPTKATIKTVTVTVTGPSFKTKAAK